MSGIVNVRELAAGTLVRLSSGADAEVVSNPGDGVWVFCRYVACADDPALVGQEEMIFAQDVVELLSLRGA